MTQPLRASERALLAASARGTIDEDLLMVLRRDIGLAINIGDPIGVGLDADGRERLAGGAVAARLVPPELS